jgi:hypothetical protein
MGHTQYYSQKRNFTDQEWVSIRGFAKGLFKELPGVLGDLMGDGGKPEATVTRIAFNGIGDEAKESFVINKKGSGYDFCKTNEKHYDIAVVACLSYINHIAKDALEITSDGWDSDWVSGCELGSKVSGVDLMIPCLIKANPKASVK